MNAGRGVLLLALGITVGHPRLVLAQPVRPAALASGEITFFTRVSSAPDFTGRVAINRAVFSGTDLSNVSGHVIVQVAAMRTGIGARDSHLRGTLNADSFPTIRFDLVGLDPGETRGDTTRAIFQGHLTIHGVTHTIRAPGTVVITAAGIEVDTRFPVNMREYGVNPPVRLIARVQPVVDVGVRVVFRY